MRAAVVVKNQDVQILEVETPKIKKDHVLVKVAACGICGSDVPRVLNNGVHFYPIILGHEFSGEVVEVGEGAENFSVGDRVAGIPLLPCFSCEDCQNGNYSLCKNYTFFGSRSQGAMAEYCLMPKTNLVKFDKSISFDVGAFFEPSSVSLHGLKCANYQGGKKVAVLGGGTIGMFAGQWAKIYGAESVTVFDISDERLLLAKELGLDFGVNTLKEGFNDEVKKITNGRGFDYVFETAGSAVTMKLAFELAANKASVCFIGTPTSDLCFTPKEFENMNRKEFTLTGSWMSYSTPFPGEEWELTAHFFKTGQLKIADSFVYKKYPLEKTMAAFEEFLEKGRVKGKILIVNEQR